MAASVYTGGEVGTGSVQGSTVGRADNEDMGKRHTSCGGKMGKCAASWAAEDQCEVVLWQEVEVRTLGSKQASEDKSGQSNGWDGQAGWAAAS